MTEKIAIILAAGSQERWDGSGKKQLLPVFNDEILISRTIRQSLPLWDNVWVATHDEEIASVSSKAGADIINFPQATDYLCKTFYGTLPIWMLNDITILLGDVCYSPHTLSELLPGDYFRFVGRRNELFGFSFAVHIHEYVKMQIREVDIRVKKGLHGKLWQLFYVIHGQSGHELHKIPKHPEMEFIPKSDYSEDFDVVGRYNKWYKENCNDPKDA